MRSEVMTSAVLGRTIDGQSAGDLTRDEVLDNITLYWLTNTFSAELRAAFRPLRQLS
jgi:hypothetical protein